jgi:hypothetical protein
LSIGGRGGWRGAFALFVLAALGATTAPAEVRVTDAGGGRLTVEAHDATLRQVLDALRAVRPLRLHGSDALTRPVTGTYSGSLPRVLSHLLDGYDHVVHQTAAGVELDVLDPVGGPRAPAQTVVHASGPVVVPNNGRRVSSNVDLDDEAAAARPRAARSPPPTVPVQPAVLTGSIQPSDAPRISSNVDLDEERMSR